MDKLARKLKASGVDVWIDTWMIKVGDSIIDKINEGIRASDFLIVVLSRASLNSNWVREELNAATIKNIERKHAFILPILIEDCKMPALLQHRKHANFKNDPEQAFQELIEVLRPAAVKRERPKQPAALSWSKAVEVLGLLLAVILVILAVWTFVVKPWRTAMTTATTTNTPMLLAIPTAPALTETSYIEPIRKHIFRELVDAQNRGGGDEEAYDETAELWGITVDALEVIALEGIEKGWLTPTVTPIPPTPVATPTPVPPTSISAPPTSTPIRPTATHTPIPDTRLGSQLRIGETWHHQGRSLTLHDPLFIVDAGGWCQGETAMLIVDATFRNTTGQDIILRWDDRDFKLSDNVGRAYDLYDGCVSRPGYHNEVVRSGGEKSFQLPFCKDCTIQPDVTTFYIEIQSIGGIENARWEIPVY